MKQQAPHSVKRSLTIGATPETLYRAWREPEKLAECLSRSGSRDVVAEDSAWRFLAPPTRCRSWRSEVVETQENRSVAWRTTGESGCGYQARISFAPAPRDLGTEATLEIQSEAGPLSRTLGKLSGQGPEEYAVRLLRNLKQYMETGEVATNEGPQGDKRMIRRDVSKAAMTAGLVLAAGLFYARRLGGERRSA